MSWAMVVDGIIRSEQDRLPSSAKRLDTGLWEHLGTAWTAELAAQFGYYPVTETDRPTDTADDTYDRTLVLIDAVPTVVWTVRPWTDQEQTGRVAYANEATIRSRAQAARADNSAFLTNATPTVPQVVAQVRSLTRQCNGLIRLMLAEFDGTE
jgi:hypothetical protein